MEKTEIETDRLASRRRFWVLFGLTVTALIIFGQIWRLPSALWDVTQHQFPVDLHLDYPTSYIFFAPWLQVADHLAILSLRQHVAFFVCALLLWWGYRWYVSERRVLRETL